MDITRWSTPKSDWLYSLQPKMEKLYTVNKNKTRSWLCSDHELLIAKFRLKLKTVGKTTRPFRYDPNQIPDDFTVEVRNRCKGLDLIECLFNYNGDSWHCTGREIKTIPKKKKCKTAKWLSEEALQIAVKKKEGKGKAKGKRKDIPFECRVPKNSKER